MAIPDRDLKAALLNARSAAESLAASVAVEYRRRNPGLDIQADRIPTVEALANRLPELPDLAPEPCPIFEELPILPDDGSIPDDFPLPEPRQSLPPQAFRALAAFDAETRANLLHGYGELLPPRAFLPIARAWMQASVEIEADSRETAIIPGSLFDWAGIAPTVLTAPLHDNEMPLRPGLVEPEAEPIIPGLEPRDSAIVPAPALVLAEQAGFGRLSAGSGARIDKRLLVLCLLAVPQSERRAGGRYTLRPKLRTLAHDWIWPPPAETGTGKGRRSEWRTSRHGPLLARAMNAVTLAGIVLPDRREWRPVMFRVLPDFANLDSRAQIEIALPEESDHGPLIRRDALIAAGTVSDPAFDGSLVLASLWDRAKAANGGRRIYATRPRVLRDADGFLLSALRGPDGAILPGADGRPQPTGRILGHACNPFRGRNGKLQWRQGEAPQRDWRHPQAVRIGEERHPHAGKVAALGRDDRRRLFHGHASDKLAANSRVKAANRADARLRTLEIERRVVIEDCGRDGWRILEAAPNRPHGARASP